MKITATISTRNRYFTSLPLCLMSIALQTKVPDELIIFDDGDRLDLRKEPIYQNIFDHLTKRGVFWHVEFGSGEGQVKNHQKALEIAKHPTIWRLDDDNIPDANVLEVLFNEMRAKCGAIGGLVLDPKVNLIPNKMASSKIQDIFLGLNEQWFPHEKPTIKSVDHLYSTFLFRKEAATHGYEKTLSRIGHREETIFTYEMKRKGWNLYVTPHCTTWHYQMPSGGIRDNSKKEMWDHDEEIFRKKMKAWSIDTTNMLPIVLECGLGDHYAFKTIFPEIIEKHKDDKIILASCHPNLFSTFTNIKHITIDDAKNMLGEKFETLNIYKWMVDNNWGGHIIDAFRKMYKLDG